MKKQPYVVTLEKGKNYAWCECAESQTQPFCDGSHTKVNKRNENLIENLQEISLITDDSQKLVATDTKAPVVFSAEKDSEVSLCAAVKNQITLRIVVEHTRIFKK